MTESGREVCDNDSLNPKHLRFKFLDEDRLSKESRIENKGLTRFLVRSGADLPIFLRPRDAISDLALVQILHLPFHLLQARDLTLDSLDLAFHLPFEYCILQGIRRWFEAGG